jgi:hypothetical protein
MSQSHVEQIYINAVSNLRKEINNLSMSTIRVPSENELNALESLLEHITKCEKSLNKSYSKAESFLDKYKK